MKPYKAGERVGPGVYLNMRTLAFISLPEEGALPGGRADRYRQVPAVAMLLVGPALGAAYIVFLPFVGLTMLSLAIAERIGSALGAYVQRGHKEAV